MTVVVKLKSNCLVFVVVAIVFDLCCLMMTLYNGRPPNKGAEAFLLGAGATTVGYLLYGGLSFGFTEFLKRRFVELAGPGLAALYPIPILLGARCVCSRILMYC